MPKCVLNWSGGKDCTLSLHKLSLDPNFSVATLLTTIDANSLRISMHGVSRAILKQQALALDIPLKIIELPASTSTETYSNLMETALNELSIEGVDTAIFGDIFLEDLKLFREKNLEKIGFKSTFPLWKKKSSDVVNEFISLGYEAIVVCVNGSCLSKDFLGRKIDHTFLKDLPTTVDPCGENGEFHTFVINGPIFKHPVDVQLKEIVQKNYPSPNGSGESIPYYFQELSLVDDFRN